jgi:hypothetical protein
MKTYVQEKGFEVWKSFVDGYKEPKIPQSNDTGRKLNLNNSKSKNALLNGLIDSLYGKVMHCSSITEIWDKLQNIYEGDAKFKGEKLQTYIGHFEQLKMKEDENIATYLLRMSVL